MQCMCHRNDGILIALLYFIYTLCKFIFIRGFTMNVKAAFFALFAFSGMAQADLVATDWKTSGDALATLHEETGIEWLKPTACLFRKSSTKLPRAVHSKGGACQLLMKSTRLLAMRSTESFRPTQRKYKAEILTNLFTVNLRT